MRWWWLVGVVLLGGCSGAPIEGEWESSKLGNGRRNSLSIQGDGSGEATIFATPESQLDAWVGFAFDVAWAEAGDEYELELECSKGPCNDDDFEMDCQVIDEGDGDPHRLDCEVTKNARWAKYPFDWEREE